MPDEPRQHRRMAAPLVNDRDDGDDGDDERDDLDELIAEITKQNPNFPALLAEALRERMAMIARGEDPNDIPWDDEEDEAQETSQETSAAQPTAPRPT